MILRARHLHDDRLADCYLTARHGDTIDPRLAEHLADCDACSARYAELARVMDSLREAGEAETDAVFPPERLREQRDLIARRIAGVGRPARVISFPRRLVDRTMTASATRLAPRWAAAAAAAGLFVGVALGAGYEWNVRARPTPPAVTAESVRPPHVAPAPTRSVSAPDGADELFLSELEIALERPHTRELQAFDEFTPRVREIRNLSR